MDDLMAEAAGAAQAMAGRGAAKSRAWHTHMGQSTDEYEVELSAVGSSAGTSSGGAQSSPKFADIGKEVWAVGAGAKPSIAKARRYLHELALPRKIETQDGEFRLAGPLEAGGKPFPLWSTTWADLTGFGAGVTIYFRMLRQFSMIMIVGGLILVANIVHYSEPGFDPMTDGAGFLTGSAVCRPVNVTCMTSDGSLLSHHPVLPNSTGEPLPITHKPCKLDLKIGMVDMVCFAVMTMLMAIALRSESQVQGTIKKKAHLSSDFSVMVHNPPLHETDPATWKKYFERYGPVVFVTVALDNSELLKYLAKEWRIQRQIEMETGKSLNSKSSVNALTGDDGSGGGGGGGCGWLCCVKDLRYWKRKLSQVRRKIHELQKRAYVAQRVFVTFDTEASQRRCLKELSDGVVPTMLQCSFRVFDHLRYTDARGKRHQLSVEKADAPSEVVWENLHYSYLWQGVLQTATFGAVLLYAVGLLYALQIFYSIDPFLTAAFIQVENQLAPTLIGLLHAFESHTNKTAQEASLFWKLLIIRINSSAIIPLLISSILKGASGTNEKEALLQVQTILITDALLGPFLRAANITARLKRWFLAPYAPTQEKMNFYYKGSSWHLGERYTDMIKRLFLSMFYMTLLPMGLFITAGAFLTQYAADKYLLLRQWRTHNVYNAEVARASQIPICVCFLVHVVMAANFFAAWPFDQVCGVDRNLAQNKAAYQIDPNPDPRSLVYKCCADLEASSHYSDQIHKWLWPGIPGDGRMTDDQEYLVQIYRAGIVLYIVPMLLVFFSHKIINTFYWLFTGLYKSVSAAEEEASVELDRFTSDDLGGGSLTAYVPQVDQPGLLYPLIACDTQAIDPKFCARWQYTGRYNIAFHSALQEQNSLHRRLETLFTKKDDAAKGAGTGGAGAPRYLSECRQYSIDEKVAYSYFETWKHGKVVKPSPVMFRDLPEIKRADLVLKKREEKKGKPDRKASPFTEDKDRRCTDVCFLGLLVCFWLGTVVLVSFAQKYGKPERLLYGDDFEGRTCGTGELADRKLVYYPTLQEDLIRAYDPFKGGLTRVPDFFGVCVQNCPKRGEVVNWTATERDRNGELSRVPFEKAAEFDTSNVLYRCLYFNEIETNYTIQCLSPFTITKELNVTDGAGGTRSVPVPAPIRCANERNCQIKLGEWNRDRDQGSAFTGADCVKARVLKTTATDQPAKSDPVFDQLSSIVALLSRWMGDILQAAIPIVLCGLVFGVLFSVVWLVLIEHFAYRMVWGTIICLFGLLLFFTLYLYHYAGLLDLTHIMGKIYAPVSSTVSATGLTSNDYFERVTNSEYFEAVSDVAGSAKSVAKSTISAVSPDAAYFNHFSKQHIAYAAHGFAGLDVLLLLLLASVRAKITTGVGIIKEASKAVQAMPALLFFPVLPNLLVGAFTAVWIYYGAFLASMGQYELNNFANFTDPYSARLGGYTGAVSSSIPFSGIGGGSSSGSNGTTTLDTATDEAFDIYNQTNARLAKFLDFGNTKTYVLVGYTFVFVWTATFLHAIETCTIAGAVSQWYWRKDKRKFDHAAVWHAFSRTVRFHLGSLAYGSLIIGAVHMIRLFLSYSMHRTQGLQRHSKLLKLVMCCVHCCLRCLEKCGKYIGNVGYIIVATRGFSFCRSTREAMGLLMSNFSRVGIVHTFSAILITLGKFLVTVLCTFCLFMMVTNADAIPYNYYGKSGLTGISSPLFPMLACSVLAFVVASYCCNIYSAAIDTIMVSFCEDKKLNRDAHSYFMSPALQRQIDKHTAKAHAFDSNDEAHHSDHHPSADHTFTEADAYDAHAKDYDPYAHNPNTFPPGSAGAVGGIGGGGIGGGGGDDGDGMTTNPLNRSHHHSSKAHGGNKERKVSIDVGAGGLTENPLSRMARGHRHGHHGKHLVQKDSVKKMMTEAEV